MISCGDAAAIFNPTLNVTEGSANLNVTFITDPSGKAVLLTARFPNGTVAAAANYFPRAPNLRVSMPTTAFVGDTISLTIGAC
jgi:hypothetical protein